MKRETGRQPVLDFIFLTLALLGFAINLLLLVRRFSDAAAGIAGCGGGACEEILASRWSSVFGVPVTVFGAAVYFALMLSLIDCFRRSHAPLLGMIAGAAAWFVFVQVVLVGKLCPWCMAAHGVGIAVLVVGLLRSGVVKTAFIWSVTAFLAIGLAQVYGPVPATHRIDELPPAAQGRSVSFDGGRIMHDSAKLPLLGSPGAKHILAEYFDYQCPACRTMAGFLDALVARHPADVAVLLLPVPLERTCNAHVTSGNEHPGSCETARIALAVWRVKRDAFTNFHHALIADPSPESARRLALEIMPPDRLAAALSDPWIDDLIRADIADWHMFSSTTDKLPKLLVRDKRILHGLPSGEQDFIRVMERELGL
jgi:uncharacterized membrane protein